MEDGIAGVDAALRIALVTVPRVSRSCEHPPDGFNLRVLKFRVQGWTEVAVEDGVAGVDGERAPEVVLGQLVLLLLQVDRPQPIPVQGSGF